ncbi:phosphomannomutase/phosphoglucomutase [Listeria sp. PSOL-1]|uniref:phosphomannomutase/phosphoglucomutase n=1 Tax=Listeria sp. PSOL-1 TaxID=1844999 RepID=UPI0013D82B9B|nr:phosphomannomutase/phosphoglucomutase [Listeria sp. PSOL-1]
MIQTDLKTLQNGSDIRGIGSEMPDYEITLTNERIRAIAFGFANWLKDKKRLSGRVKVAIGHDSRLSAERIKGELLTSLSATGIDIIDVGLSTTPAMFMATKYQGYEADAAIMITASHLPYFYNGLKFFTKDGGLEHVDMAYLLEHTEENRWFDGGQVVVKNLLATYASDLVSKIKGNKNEEFPLLGSHIIVDAGNGAGGFFATEVLQKLGANITGSQFLEPDGRFPNHVPNPDNREAMASLKRAVVENGADLGVIFDTDVDRSAFVDHQGKSFNRQSLIALIATMVLKEHPHTTIVTDSTTSDYLFDFVATLGGKIHRFKRGYRNVINEAIRLNEAGEKTELAIEVSGHAAFKENYFLDDGAYLISKILMNYGEISASGQTFADLIADFKQPKESKEARLYIQAENFKEYGQEILAALPAFIGKLAGFSIVEPNFEGVRVKTKVGWFLLRMSLHEPVMSLHLEADEVGGVQQMVTALKPFFAKFSGLVTVTLE